ncbi:MAG: hypothetical protein WAL66_08685 [Nitrososphaeraceae archaeon]
MCKISPLKRAREQESKRAREQKARWLIEVVTLSVLEANAKQRASVL